MNWLEKRWYASKLAPCWMTPLEKLFVSLAKRKKQQGLEQSWTAPVPVIIVGNISVGGTGKTPLVNYLVDLFKSEGYSPGVISRGYRSEAPTYPFDVSHAENIRQCGDEPFLIHQHSDCPVIIDANRVNAAKYLLDHYDCDLIISDDGLQHYRLDRDIEIAVIDGKRGLGNGHCLPAGPLRESGERLQTVDFVVSNGELSEAFASTDALSNVHMNKTVCNMRLAPVQFQRTDRSEQVSLAAFSGKAVHAVAGIGNPQRFFDTLQPLIKSELKEHVFPDHHHYSSADLDFPDDDPVIMTEKDAVKASSFTLSNAWYLEVTAQLPENFAIQLITQFKTILKTKGIDNNG